MAQEDLYRRLQRHLDRMPIGFPATESGVEIRILKHLFTPEEAEIALELSAIPEPLPAIHKRLAKSMTAAQLGEALDRMAAKGSIERHRVGGEPRYGKAIFAVGMYEYQVDRLTEAFERDAIQYLQGEFGAAFHNKKTPQLRTVPVNRTIAVERCVATYDDIREFVRTSPGPFARMNCVCRQGRELLGETCRQTRVRDNCLTIGPAAQAMAHRGVARFIGREEMLRVLDEADEEGLVLQPQNTKNPLFVCCCCGCCCGVLTSAKRFPCPAEYFSSNYFAEVDGEACQACATCQTRCQMDALSLDGGKTQVDLARCIGCGLCVTTCPSGALRLKQKTTQWVPPDDTPALYTRILQQRFGPLGMAVVAGRKVLGMKI